jgi:hypothetical protein
MKRMKAVNNFYSLICGETVQSKYGHTLARRGGIFLIDE